MVIRLLPVQISNHWEVIKCAIEDSLPPIAGESPEKMNRILMNLLDGKMQCWVRVDEDKKINLIVVTTISEDFCSGTKTLLLYCAFGYGSGHKVMWKELYDTFYKFGQSRGCDRCIAYSDNEYLIKILEYLGGDARYRMITFPIGEPDESL